MRSISTPVAALAGGLALCLAGSAAAQQKGEILIGAQCDRTGPTQIVGVRLCPAIQDYISLINSKGGIEGYKIVAREIDHEYKVPPAMESYERFKSDGAVSIMIYGTSQAANGARYPYLFPIAATYWSQGAAAVSFVKEKLGGSLAGKKIAYVFYDNPAGHEPIAIIEDLQKLEKFELRTFAVPPPGVELGAQVLDISQRFRPDFVIAHLFGRSPSVAIKELKRAGYPLSKVVGLVWASAEDDIAAAGGWSVAEGYHTLQFAGVGDDYPARKDIVAMYKAQGKEPPKEMASTVYYNRGLLIAAVHTEAIRNAIKAKGGAKPTGEDVRKGFEAIKGFTLGGLVPPIEVTAANHEGGGWVQVFQAKGGKFA